MIIKRGIDSAINRSTVRFCMPGHKGIDGNCFYDVTELDGTDNLHNPNGIIKKAQLEASCAFGAAYTFFCVNGSSVGLHALILSVCNRGDTLIIDRSCHISVINALVLFDIQPVFVYPKHNSAFGVSDGISPNDIQDAIEKNPHAKGVLITSPTYYGVCSDVFSIASVAHRNNMPLLVDEAHGAHFGFNHRLPESALSCCGDGVVQSAHKTLPCLTQGAMVHIGTNRISPDRLLQNLNMLQTTSPSYLIMKSIDEARETMQKTGKAKLGRLIDACNDLRLQLNSTGKFYCMDKHNAGYQYDSTRIVINTNINAEVIKTRLKKSNIVIEMADTHNLVCIATINNRVSDFTRFKTALLAIAKDLPEYKEAKTTPLPQTILKASPNDAFYSETVSLKSTDAIGKIAARSIYSCPPCMPLLCPGEVVTEEIACLCKQDIIVVKD